MMMANRDCCGAPDGIDPVPCVGDNPDALCPRDCGWYNPPDADGSAVFVD